MGGQWQKAGSRTGKSSRREKKPAVEKSPENRDFREEGRKDRGQGHRKQRENMADRKMRRIPEEKGKMRQTGRRRQIKQSRQGSAAAAEPWRLRLQKAAVCCFLFIRNFSLCRTERTVMSAPPRGKAYSLCIPGICHEVYG